MLIKKHPDKAINLLLKVNTLRRRVGLWTLGVFLLGYFLAHCFLVPTSIGLCSLVRNWWFALLQDANDASWLRHGDMSWNLPRQQKTPFANKFFLISQYGWENRQISLPVLSLLCIFSWCSYWMPYNEQRFFCTSKRSGRQVMALTWPGLCSAAGASEAASASLALTIWGSWAHTLAKDGHHCLFPEDIQKSLHSVLQRQGILGLFKRISESSANYKQSTTDCQKLTLFLAFWAVKIWKVSRGRLMPPSHLCAPFWLLLLHDTYCSEFLQLGNWISISYNAAAPPTSTPTSS